MKKKKIWFLKNYIPFKWKYWNLNWIELNSNSTKFNLIIRLRFNWKEMNANCWRKYWKYGHEYDVGKENPEKGTFSCLFIWGWAKHIMGWIIWTKTCAYLGTSDPDLGSFMLGFESYWDLKICPERCCWAWNWIQICLSSNWDLICPYMWTFGFLLGP